MLVFDHKQILVCAQSKDAASENLEKIRLAYEYCPNFLKKGVIGSNKTTMEFDNGSKIFVRPSNSNAPRGLTPSIVYVDEFAFIGSQDSAEKGLEKQNEFFSALTPSLSSSKVIFAIIVLFTSPLLYDLNGILFGLKLLLLEEFKLLFDLPEL